MERPPLGNTAGSLAKPRNYREPPNAQEMGTAHGQWLKVHGHGYQTRINHILRAAMERPRAPALADAHQTQKLAWRPETGRS